MTVPASWNCAGSTGFIAPKLFGGMNSKTPVEGIGVRFFRSSKAEMYRYLPDR